jgi:serine/threonine protein kinase
VTSQSGEWIGMEILSGRYKVQGRIGQGSMGQVYLAYDRHLETDVVLKFPIATDKASGNPDFLDRFSREIRSLVQLSHPHIVRVIDVGELEGHPFVVMQFLAGGSLKDRQASGPGGEIQAMPPESLAEWLPDIARALDFVHAQKHIHRDVKPANILFDRHGHSFLTDFGIIKALTSDETDWQSNSLTAPGFLIGTPNYVAPEIVMGRPFDGRVDQYALGMTVHEVLCGTNCMEGPTPSATVVNQTMVEPTPLSEMVSGISKRLSSAIQRALSKDPAERFESCSALAQEVMAAVPSGAIGPVSSTTCTPSSRGAPGRVPCPACATPLPVGREHAGGRVRCPGCQALSQVSLLSSNTVQLKLIESVPRSTAPTSVIVVDGSDEDALVDSGAATVIAAKPGTFEHTGQSSAPTPGSTNVAVSQDSGASPVLAAGNDSRRFHWIAWSALALLLVVGAILTRGIWGRIPPVAKARAGNDTTAPSAGATSGQPAVAPAEPDRVEINIAYGTEKQRWLEAATAEFQQSKAGQGITIHLHGMGSLEGAKAVIDGPRPVPFQVWSPASSAYRDTFEREWRTHHDNRPILKAENLALTPMAFVMWRSRHEPFIKKYSKVGFKTISQAMREPGGWRAIGEQPDWGRFKFGHTHPDRSNSGFLALVLLAYEYSGKDRNLMHEDIARVEFQEWLRTFEQGVARPGGSLTHSTGTLMKEMVLRGPSQYDCLITYENLAIDYLDAARDHWGELEVDYPDPNIWNEHPYYILDVPWSDARQQAAAAVFLNFLMSEPIQKKALDHGFRPGNPAVSVRFPASPLIRHASQGIKIDLPRMCEPPNSEVVEELLASSRRLEQ